MLQEKNFYIMKIIFDGQEYILTLESGTNPKFKFDKIITKEMKFDQMETKYLEIILYNVPSTFDIFKENNIENIIKKAKIYSSFKIDLLTVAVGPECHNIILRSPSHKVERLGRIMYTITCKQITNISVKINSVKVQMNGLLQNNVALSLKYKDKNKQRSTMYTHEINPNLNQKENITEYNYLVNDNMTNPLFINIISSMYDFISNDSYLYVYSIRLINKNVQNNNDYNTGLIFENNPELKNNKNLNNNLINHYTKIGSSLLSFLEILSENDEALNKQTSQFFRHMSGFNTAVEKIQKNHPKSESELKTFTIQIFQNISRNYITPLYYDGNEIGTCQIDISINNMASIRQIMCGVLTENGFEINSIHLYDNVLSEKEESTLPQEITKLMNTKRSLDNELIKAKDIQPKINQDSFKINELLKELKKTLNETIEVDYLYYGYLDKKDLLTGQNIMLDIGISLMKIIDKVNKEHRSLIFDILRLINERGEFDLGTLSSHWFAEKNNIDNNKVFTFKDSILLKDKIIENFFEFNYKCLEYSLAKINKGKIIEQEIKEFCIYYINIAYFRIPLFRNKLLVLISSGVNEKFEEIMNRNTKGKKSNHENANIQDLLEIDPINNLLLWENLFYDKLKSSLEENNKTERIENEINDKFAKLKYLMENNTVQEENWTEVFLQKGNIFFGLIIRLANYIIKKSESNDINWLNIPGFVLLLNALTHEIYIRPANSYPQILKNVFKLFINLPEIPNTFIKEIIYRTNAYDVNGIFNIFDIISSLFQEYMSKNPNKLFEKFNYNLLNQVIKHIMKVDHSLCVSKVLLFYYNYAHLIPTAHLGDFCQNFLGKRFYALFFHWSFEVRDKFFYLILFILDFKIKGLVPYQDLEDLKIAKDNNTGEYLGVNVNKSFGDILEIKLRLINELQTIIINENKDIDFNNKIDENRYKNILVSIPLDVHKNIVVSLHHYNKIYKEFAEFIRTNKNRNNIEYPQLILVPPKDDYIEYEK
jgi:hypothetical protein